MPRRHLSLIPALLLLTGCAMDEESFATKYAEEYCAYHEECGTIEYVGGLMKYIWDFVNPPPHLQRVRIEQSDGGPGASRVATVYDRSWRERFDSGTLQSSFRDLLDPYSGRLS